MAGQARTIMARSSSPPASPGWCWPGAQIRRRRRPADPGPQLAGAALPSCLGSGGLPTPLCRRTANRAGQLDAGAGGGTRPARWRRWRWGLGLAHGSVPGCLGSASGRLDAAGGSRPATRAGTVWGPGRMGPRGDGPAGGLGQGARPARRGRGARPPARRRRRKAAFTISHICQVGRPRPSDLIARRPGPGAGQVRTAPLSRRGQ